MDSDSQFYWDDLLLQIEDRRVVPIVGPALLVTRVDDEPVLLHRHLAVRLAEKLGIDESELPPAFGLNHVAVKYIRDHRKPQRVYSRLRGLMDEIQVPIPEPLEKLAAIRHFDLFVTTTFDSLLAQAIEKVRFSGDQRVRTLAFSPHLRVQDLPCEAHGLGGPLVYHLFGPLTSSTDYAITDEDVLEFVHALQSEERRPKILFDELRNNHLLVLGCGHADWLARFFLRTVRNERLSIPGMSEFIADDVIARDPKLMAFLEQCAAEAYVTGDAVRFVDELHARWSRRHGAKKTPLERTEDQPAQMEHESIFLSYASDDRPAAQKIRTALESVGLDVWFDQRRLRSGDDWDHEIRRNIKRCSLFLPVISRRSARRREGYFRKEWFWAIKRAEGIDQRFPFIHPIVIDDTPPDGEGIPPFFVARHWQRVTDAPPREFLERLRKLVRDWREAKAGLA